MKQTQNFKLIFISLLLYLPLLVSSTTDPEKSTQSLFSTENPEQPAGVATFNIYLDPLDEALMVQLRNEAFDLGVQTKKTKQKFPCVIEYKGKRYSGKIRFKGDLTDHLWGEHWSYRIELNSGHMINGKSTFSIQRPATRGFGQEWLVHQLCAANDVLSTNYSFLPVSLNGKESTIYAFEEHFEKQLLESQSRREGAILKFDEELFWSWVYLEKTSEQKGHFPHFEASPMLPFSKKRFLKSKAMKEHLELGLNLVQLYKNGDLEIADYLDIERFAKYNAILTLANAAHARNNQRWYVNPVTALLEPIGYDCYSHHDTKNDDNLYFRYTMQKQWSWPKISPYDYFLTFLYRIPEFQKSYLKHLERITEKSYLHSFFNSIDGDIQHINKLLSSDRYPKVDTALLQSNAKQIGVEMSKFKQWLEKDIVKTYKDTANRRSEIDPSGSPVIPIIAYHEGENEYTLQNFGGQTATVISYDPLVGSEPIQLQERLILGTSDWLVDQVEVKIDQPASKFYYTLEGDSGVYSTTSYKWASPKAVSPRRSLRELPQNPDGILTVEGDDLRIKSGSYTLKQLLFIPSGHRLVIEPGVTITLEEGGGIISESSASMKGSKENPITISSASLNHGFSVMRTSDRSELEHVQFIGMSNLSWMGWTLTGGVNFYEANVSVQNCSFKDAVCEDALNIIRSDFDMELSRIENAKSDGFDSDFCNGTVTNCTFVNIGNDGVDFSGSEVSLKNCTLTGINDKAISCGEDSKIKASDLNIKGANVGVAAKDLSKVSIVGLNISDCVYGYVAYNKKKEYGGAYIEVSNVTSANIEHEYDIELKSALTRSGKTIRGKKYSGVTKY